jgi:hypothetical protein
MTRVQVYLGLEYDTKGVDVKLYDTARPGSVDDQYLDIVSPTCPKIKRKQCVHLTLCWQ